MCMQDEGCSAPSEACPCFLDVCKLTVLGLALAWPLGDGQVSVSSALQAEGHDGANAGCAGKDTRGAACLGNWSLMSESG